VYLTHLQPASSRVAELVSESLSKSVV